MSILSMFILLFTCEFFFFFVYLNKCIAGNIYFLFIKEHYYYFLNYCYYFIVLFIGCKIKINQN